MKTYHKDFTGVTASITDKRDGTARLIVRFPGRRKARESVHKNRRAALSAWYRVCN